jgi:hypothetical protein
MAYKNKLKEAFASCKSDATRRGVEWRLTFDEWLSIWQASGHLHERGQGAGKYCMARHGDIGPYATDNVKIITHSENSREVNTHIPRKLTSALVLEIRALAENGVEVKELAAMYGISLQATYDIVNNVTWID